MKKILLQFSGTPSRIEGLITACRNTGIEYEFFSYYSSSTLIDDIPEDILNDRFFTFSTIPPLFYALKKDSQYYKNESDFHLYNDKFINSFYGEDFFKFEQEYITKAIKDKTIAQIPMLNAENKIMHLTNIDLKHKFEEEIFIKPNNAFKSFIGGVTIPGETFEEFLFRKKLGTSFDINIMVSPFYKIHSEYRFFVYNGIPIEWSSYIQQGVFNKTVVTPDIVIQEAFKLAKEYQPGKAFVLDLCLLDNGDIKIVEYNHLSASGNYSCTLEKTIQAICSDE